VTWSDAVAFYSSHHIVTWEYLPSRKVGSWSKEQDLSSPLFLSRICTSLSLGGKMADGGVHKSSVIHNFFLKTKCQPCIGTCQAVPKSCPDDDRFMSFAESHPHNFVHSYRLQAKFTSNWSRFLLLCPSPSQQRVVLFVSGHKKRALQRVTCERVEVVWERKHVGVRVTPYHTVSITCNEGERRFSSTATSGEWLLNYAFSAFQCAHGPFVRSHTPPYKTVPNVTLSGKFDFKLLN